MTMARPNMSQTWLQSISWHEPIFATCVAICTKPWRCPNVDAVIWEWLVHDLTIFKLLAIPALGQSSLQTRTDAPRLVVCREAFYFWLLDFKPWWCLDRGMVAPWSANSQAVSAISALAHLKLCSLYRCTLHSESARLVLLQMEVSGMAPGLSFLSHRVFKCWRMSPCTFEDTARSFWSSKPAARLKLIWLL